MSRLDRIALVGLPGAGKSSVARALAARLGWTSVDLDEVVTARAGDSIAAIVATRGEPAFRRLELEALDAALQGGEPVVIGCGGGLIAQPEARPRLLRETCVVWLDADDAVLASRVGGGTGRPLLGGDPGRALPSLRAARAGAHACAHLRVETDAPVAGVAARIATALAGSVRLVTATQTCMVEVRPGAVDDVALHLPPGASTVAVLADRAVAAVAARVAGAVERAGARVVVIEVDAGEALKTWARAGELLTQLADSGLRREDCLVAVGGGSVGDATGFVAATYLRGIAWLNVPTTLLAMVDSSIGGKTGVNLQQGKNLAGAFWQPRAVVSDPEVLATLPEGPFRSSFGEIVKYAMIRPDGIAEALDANLDQLLQRDPAALHDVVSRCAAAKAAVVSADERDDGVRATLNYGHTVAHALEAATGFGDAVTHGEAVAVGMRVAGRLSMRVLGCPAADVAWQDEQLRRCGLGAAPRLDAGALLRHMGLDKKVTASGIGWVLLVRRGEPRTHQLVTEPLVRETLAEVMPA